jgi:hypothetical protein
VLPDHAGQWISAQIFKGASIWEGNRYIDVGSFQFYGMSIDSVVHAEVCEETQIKLPGLNAISAFKPRMFQDRLGAN